MRNKKIESLEERVRKNRENLSKQDAVSYTHLK